MKAKLITGIGSGVFMSLLLLAALSVSVGAALPAGDVLAEDAPPRVDICHLQKKVDPTLTFNDGRIITPSTASCVAHCNHGDHPMSDRSCARVHFPDGAPSCQVNTPSPGCSEARCIALCQG